MFVDALPMDYGPQSAVLPGLLPIDEACRKLRQS